MPNVGEFSPDQFTIQGAFEEHMGVNMVNREN